MTDADTEMKIDPARAAALVSQLQSVTERIASAAKGRNVWQSQLYLPACDLPTNRHRQVRLVAVSKLKPANDILALHQAPSSHAHFGENYAQELGQKADMLPKSIQWHFIGGLQSGKTLKIMKLSHIVHKLSS